MQRAHEINLCHFCNDNFEYLEELREHKKTCQDKQLQPITATEKNFLCYVCGFATDKSKPFISHMNVRHQLEIKICRKCSGFVPESEAPAHRVLCDTAEKLLAESLRSNSQKTDSHFETKSTENCSSTAKTSKDNLVFETVENPSDKSSEFLENQHSTEEIYRSTEKTVHVLLDDPKSVEYPAITFTSDPKEISDFCEVYSEHWKSIMSFYKIAKISRLFNCRLSGEDDLENIRKFMLKFIYPSMKRAFKIWLSPSLILKHRATGKMIFYWPSRFNNCLPDDPHLIKNKVDFDSYVKKVLEIDFDEIFGYRPDTSYSLLCFTAISFYAVETHIPIGVIGAPVDLPIYLTKNKFLISLATCKQYKKSMDDNLCFFRCLQIHKQVNESGKKPAEASSLRLSYKKEVKAALKLASEFYGKPVNRETFKGIKFADLPALEQFFKININVYQAENCKRAGPISQRNVLLARTLYCGLGNFPSTLHMNEYKNHFSYIVEPKKFVKAFLCKKCSKAFTAHYTCRIHERVCEAARSLRLINRPYRPRKNIFELLEEEGFSADEDCPSSYPFRVTYDFESYFENSNVEVNETESSHYSTHRIMSVAFVSNVPGYEEPTCYVNEGDEKELVLRFLRQLNIISKAAEG